MREGAPVVSVDAKVSELGIKKGTDARNRL